MKKLIISGFGIIIIIVIVIMALNIFSGISSLPPNVDIHGCIPIQGTVEQDRIVDGNYICVFKKMDPSGRDMINISVYDPKNLDSNEHSFTLAYILSDQSEDCRKMKQATNPEEKCCWADSRIFMSTENKVYACETHGAV